MTNDPRAYTDAEKMQDINTVENQQEQSEKENTVVETNSETLEVTEEEISVIPSSEESNDVKLRETTEPGNNQEGHDGTVSEENKEGITPEKEKSDTIGSIEKDEKFVVEDYSQYDRAALIELLRKLVEYGDVDVVKEDIDAIKFLFYKQLKAETDKKRTDFINSGGSENDYIYEEDSLELILKSLLNKYRESRNIHNERIEAEKQKNLVEKLTIIEELKELTNGTESIGETFQLFRDLQSRWRSIGIVPQSEVKNLWETYHHYVEVFYDYIKINKELRDLDFKRNLEAKIELCEKSEELLLDPSVVNAFHTLQSYHDKWREIGPVPQEMRVEIWERFKAISSQINKKHQEYFDSLKENQKQNLEAKESLCMKVEEISNRPMSTMAHWEKNSKEIIELQKLWNTIGYAPKKENAKIYKRFHSLCDYFFNQKREFFAKEKGEQENNLQLKEDLCIQVEALKDSEEWKTATDEIIHLQKRWKEIGSVPSKYREVIWKRFRAACDHFFTRKSNHFSSVDSEYDLNLKNKQDLIDRIKKFVHSDNPEETFEQLKNFQREWSEIGFVPIKFKKKIQEEYRNAINQQFDSLKLDESKRNILRYKNKIEHLASGPSRNKLDSEREKLMRKYQQLQNDLIVWENNIGFFSKSKNSESMIANVQRMIEQGHSEMKSLEEKIRLIDKMDND